MRKRILVLLGVAVIIAASMLAGGCNGKVSMVTGVWQVVSTGDETGQNQKQYSMPIAVYYCVYPDGHVKYLIAGEAVPYGSYTMDRDTFTFKADEGTESYSGQFVINNQATDASTGNAYTSLTIYPDNQKMSAVLKKVMDYSSLVKYLKEHATASPAPVASPAPTVTP